MPDELLAALAAFLFALTSVAAKRGLQDTSVAAGVLITLLTATAIAWAAVAFDPPSEIHATGIAYYCAGGVAGFGIGRAASVTGIQRLGAATSVPLEGIIYPLTAVLAAVTVLGERVRPIQVLGAASIVLGVSLVAGNINTGAERVGESTEAPDGPPRRPPRDKRAMVFPFFAGACFGVADILRKNGVEAIPDPLFGTAVGLAMGSAIWILSIRLHPPTREGMIFGASKGWFALSGVSLVGAVFTVIRALQHGDVSVVSPLIATQPLSVLLLSPLLLRSTERIDLRVVAGVCAMVAGSIAVSI